MCLLYQVLLVLWVVVQGLVPLSVLWVLQARLLLLALARLLDLATSILLRVRPVSRVVLWLALLARRRLFRQPV
jgi:hypothetical protein